MLSLDNAFDADDFAEFCDRIRRFLGLRRTNLRVRRRAEDRRAVDLADLRGRRFVRGATRGDGAEGEDVTANLRTMPPCRAR